MQTKRLAMIIIWPAKKRGLKPVIKTYQNVWLNRDRQTKNYNIDEPVSQQNSALPENR